MNEFVLLSLLLAFFVVIVSIMVPVSSLLNVTHFRSVFPFHPPESITKPLVV